MKLKDILSNFNGSSDEVSLQRIFEELAPSLLYGGYLQIHNDFQVFIKTVEFYYHSEKENGIHDPIVYHRNIRNVDGTVFRKVPYFPTMSLHAHNSGFDITFENETEEYRASVLIRAYEVKDKDGNFLIWGKNEESKEYMFLPSLSYGFNTQSTYLYSLLNGFPLGVANDILWIDSPRQQSALPEQKPRKNVFKSESVWKYIPLKNDKCGRLWSFTRKEKV